MVLYAVMLACLAVLPHYDVTSLPRSKRDATGALDILTNHAQPIHAEVKPDGGTGITDKPCPKNKNLPSHIESGVVFQVTPPENILYQTKSFRKSLVQLPSQLDLARNIGRVITMTALLVVTLLEFYPTLQNLYLTIYSFLYL